MHLCSPPQPRS